MTKIKNNKLTFPIRWDGDKLVEKFGIKPSINLINGNVVINITGEEVTLTKHDTSELAWNNLIQSIKLKKNFNLSI